LHLVVTVLAAACLATVVAACSGSGGSASSSPTPSGGGTGPVAELAGSGSTKLAPGKVGILSAELSSTLTAEADYIRTTLNRIGWSATIVDGQNSPPTMQTAMQEFVSQHVEGILLLYVEPSLVTAQLAAARSAGIPVISLSNEADANAFDAIYGGDPKLQAPLSLNYIKSKVPAGSQYVVLDLSVLYEEDQYIKTTTPLLNAAGYREVGSFDINPNDLTNSIKTGALNLIQAHPQAKLIYGCSAVCLPIVGPALAQAGHQNILVMANGSPEDPPTFAQIRAGAAIADNVVNFAANGMIAVDQILAHAANGTRIDRGAANGTYKAMVIDKTNVPAGGSFAGNTSGQQYYFDQAKVQARWLAKWQKEYSF
jgi:ABC-type sugar transport system substrate-binding protein